MDTTFRDPFALISQIAASIDRPGELRAITGTDLGHPGAEILRLIDAGDTFGAGLVLSMALGRPLEIPDIVGRCDCGAALLSGTAPYCAGRCAAISA